MNSTDKALIIIALVLGVADLVPLRGGFARVRLAGLAVVLLAIVELHQGGVLNY